MKHTHFILCTLAALALTACALTPEEQAKREAEQQRAQQELHIHLAAQCSPEAAQLIRQQLEATEWANDAEKQDFRLRYIEKINDPLFQACYKMAWQNHISQQHLERIERAYFWHEHDFFWRRPMFMPYPYYRRR